MKILKRKRKLYKGVFNWYCELHILHTQAIGESEALSNFVAQLTKTLKVSKSWVYNYFIGSKKDNFKIEEVKKC